MSNYKVLLSLKFGPQSDSSVLGNWFVTSPLRYFGLNLNDNFSKQYIIVSKLLNNLLLFHTLTY